MVVTSSFSMALVMTIFEIKYRALPPAVMLFLYSNVAVLNIFPETV